MQTFVSVHQPAFRAVAASMLLLLPLWGQSVPVRVPIPAAMVVAALRSAGMEVDGSQVTLPLPITSATPQATLLITGADALREGAVRVRVACGDPHDCLPFFVMVAFRNQSAAREAASLLSPSSISLRLPIRAPGTPMLRPGDHAMLLLEDGQMQITLPVTSIDAGKVGSTIRVSSLDRKQIYVATVVNERTVRGSLP